MQKLPKKFIVGIASAISVAGVAFTAGYEGYTSKPVIPVKGDVPTIGYGTTVYPNGVKVKMNDPAITKKQAEYFLKAHMDKDAISFNRSLLGVKLSQKEYDVYMDFAYNFGIANWKSSSMLRNLKQGKHVEACNALLKWKYVAKRDCSIRKNGCYGVWVRQVERNKICLGENTT